MKIRIGHRIEADTASNTARRSVRLRIMVVNTPRRGMAMAKSQNIFLRKTRSPEAKATSIPVDKTTTKGRHIAVRKRGSV